jgi:hypothetical protein
VVRRAGEQGITFSEEELKKLNSLKLEDFKAF